MYIKVSCSRDKTNVKYSVVLYTQKNGFKSGKGHTISKKNAVATTQCSKFSFFPSFELNFSQFPCVKPIILAQVITCARAILELQKAVAACYKIHTRTRLSRGPLSLLLITLRRAERNEFPRFMSFNQRTHPAFALNTDTFLPDCFCTFYSLFISENTVSIMRFFLVFLSAKKYQRHSGVAVIAAACLPLLYYWTKFLRVW